MEKKKRTGLLFGSFNPVHAGHLLIAGYMAEHTDLDEIWFVVTPHNPLKDKGSLLEDHHRLHMVNLAIEGDDRFRSCDIEFRMKRPSYTIKTLTFLHEKYPSREWVIISGTDIFPAFSKWKNWELLLEYYRFYVYPRPGSENHELTRHPSVRVFHAPMVEISSTFIRQSVRHGLNMRYFLPDKVYDYIREMHFYEKQ